ncbi:MAG: hypothetical protein AB1696_20875 [Planctomycetota bacterium]
MSVRLLLCVSLGLAAAIQVSVRSEEAQEPLPVYVYLFAHYEDHINLELSEWRIKEVMGILDEAHKAHPDLVAAVGEFYGADSEIFRQRDKESGIVSLVRGCAKEGWYDVGYHGAHEPIYATTSQAMRGMAGKSWQEIYTATRALYTAHRDLKTGGPDASRKGGVALMQEVFGPCTVLSGAAGATNPPGMLALNDLTGCRVHFGFTDHGPAMGNRDYIPAVLEIRKAVSPSPETSPDVFWFMGCLITSSHPVSKEVGVIGSELPPEMFSAKFQRLDRSRVAVPHMIYGTKFIYARVSPTEYAYGGSQRIPPQAREVRQSRGDDFRLPPEFIFSETERRQKVENFRANLDWVLSRYFPDNPGSRFVGNRLLMDLTVPYAGESVTLAEFDWAVELLLKGWTERPPSFASTGKGYLSLAQTFKLLAVALKFHAERGSLPDSLQTDLTYGPIGVSSEVVQGKEEDMDMQAVIAAAARIAFGPERQPGSAEPPANRVPLNVTADGKTMNAAQFLRLMAEAYQALRTGKTPAALRVRPSKLLPPLAQPWQRAHPSAADTPGVYGLLQLWTVKPAQFKEAMSETQGAESRKEAIGDDRTPIQFRMNLNYFPDEAAARENCRMLRRYLDLFKQTGVKASFWFTGLAAEQIQQHAPELIRLINEAGMPVAHHGANRPPNPQPIHRVRGEDWDADVQAIMDYESHPIDPKTGALDKTKAGGLKKMQEMFGGRIAATGRFFEASILYVTKEFGCRAMIGLKGNTGGGTNAGWFLGMKGMPDAQSIGPTELRRAAAGELDLFRSIEDFTAQQSTEEVRSIAVLIHDHDFLQGSPVLPQHGFLCGSAEMQRQLWETYEELVRWAAKNPRLKVVTFEEILDQIADDRTKTASREAVLRTADAVAASPAAPPEFIDLGGDYFSLSDAFQVLAFSLADFAREGTLPETVTVRDILGPTHYRSAEKPARGALEQAQDMMQLHKEGRLTTDPGKIATTPKSQSVQIEVSGEKIIAVARSLDLAKEVPASIQVAGEDVNQAMFLQLMAQTVRNIHASKAAGTMRLRGEVNVLPRQVQQNMLADALTKLQFWTFKPERWRARAE